eukprot:6744800-Pyramimonas_sp.AAC.1
MGFQGHRLVGRRRSSSSSPAASWDLGFLNICYLGGLRCCGLGRGVVAVVAVVVVVVAEGCRVPIAVGPLADIAPRTRQACGRARQTFGV